jgi:hypothetical protein
MAGKPNLREPKGPTIYVVLDTTSLWNAFVGKSSLAFRTLSALAAKKLIRLCVPEIVVRESISQSADRVTECAAVANKNIEDLRRLSPPNLEAKFEGLGQLLSAHAARLKAALRRRIQKWISECNVLVLPVRSHHADQVIAAYFQGSAPFKRAKNRDDFPDAFIWQALIDLAADEARDIQFVSNDSAFEKHANAVGLHITVHKDILPLLTSGSLPVTTRDSDYELARQLKEAANQVEGSVRNVIHTAITDLILPMPRGIAVTDEAGPFQIERVLAIRRMRLDPDSVVPLGNHTFSLRFLATANFRGIYRSQQAQQEGTFNILKTERLRGDYLGDISGTVLLEAPDVPADWPSNARVELEEAEIVSCKPAHFVPPMSSTGDVRIRANMDLLGHAIRACRGLVLIVGRSKARKARAASVLLNDVGTTHPDCLFLATHGRLVESPTGSVRMLPRKAFEDDDAFIKKIEGIQPSEFTMRIDDPDDLRLAYYFAHASNMFIIGITDATTVEELQTLTDHVWVEAITATAT